MLSILWSLLMIDSQAVVVEKPAEAESTQAQGSKQQKSEGAAPTKDETAALVHAAKQGNERAINDLATMVRDPAFYFALQLLGNREDAMDVTQDSLMRFLGSLDRFEEGRPVLPWVRRIVRNSVIDLQRRKAVRRADSLDSDGFEGESLEVIDLESNASERAVSHERRKIVWNSLGDLAEGQREIVVLREYQDLSYQEIAALLEVPIGTVMSRLHRARIELRKKVLDRLDDSELEGLL